MYGDESRACAWPEDIYDLLQLTPAEAQQIEEHADELTPEEIAEGIVRRLKADMESVGSDAVIPLEECGVTERTYRRVAELVAASAPQSRVFGQRSEITRLLREHERSQTTHGKKAE